MSEEVISHEFDVIVVGSGGGLIGAYAAASRGLRTLVIEKTPTVGGTTAYSGAGIWLPGNAAEQRAGIDATESIEGARAYLDAIVGDDAPAELREAYLATGAAMIDELEENPVFGQFSWRGIPDYFADAPGMRPEGRTIFPAEMPRADLDDLEPLLRRPMWTERWGVDEGEVMTGGQALIGRALKAFIETGNGTVLTNTAFTGLIVEDDRVVGVEGQSDGWTVEFRATRGVILAAGGYERNGELRRSFGQTVGDEWTQGCEGNTGDALQAGIAVGAATDLLEESWFAPGLVVPEVRPVFWTTVWSGIWVNSEGERFMNERLPYDRSGHEILKAHESSGASCSPTHWIFDHKQISNERAFSRLAVDPQVPGWFDVETFIEAGVLHRADTLEELAEQIGLPAGALSKTVDEYNEFARSGTDEHYHRGEAPWDKTVVTMAGPHTDGSNPVLGAVADGPFYAAQIVVSDLGTKGGLRTDASSRVLREDGSVIAGLYASGNTMAPMSGRVYPGAGVPVGSTMLFSYRAALDAASSDV